MLLIPEECEKSQARALYDAANARWWTYAGLCGAVRRIEERLRGPKKLVFCLCRTDAATMIHYLGAVEAGHAVALLDASLDPALLSGLISQYRPEIILESQSVEIATPSGGPWHPIDPELAVLLSTSGTTGSPKFVRLAARNVKANAESIRLALGIGPEDRALASLPFHYSYGLSVLNSHLLAGASLVLPPGGLLSAGFWEACRTAQCTSMAGVPYSYQVLDRLGFESLNVRSLNTLTQAGGKLNRELTARFHEIMQRREGRFFTMYGQTEATARIAILPASDLPRKLGSAGLPIPGGSFGIRTGDGRVTMAAGIRGELVYTGPNVMLGYASSRAELAQGDCLHGTLHTGDLCELDDEGYLYVLGRLKRDAKILGYRINLDEVEALLRVHGPAAVVAGPDQVRVYCEFGDVPTLDTLRRGLAARLGLNQNAFRFERIAKLPTTESGKIDYASLG